MNERHEDEYHKLEIDSLLNQSTLLSERSEIGALGLRGYTAELEGGYFRSLINVASTCALLLLISCQAVDQPALAQLGEMELAVEAEAIAVGFNEEPRLFGQWRDPSATNAQTRGSRLLITIQTSTTASIPAWARQRYGPIRRAQYQNWFCANPSTRNFLALGGEIEVAYLRVHGDVLDSQLVRTCPSGILAG